MDDQLFQKVIAVQEKYSARLLALENVVGTAVGMKVVRGEQTMTPSLTVLVRTKYPLDQIAPAERIPTELDGVPLDVVETGSFFAN